MKEVGALCFTYVTTDVQGLFTGHQQALPQA